MKGDIQPKEDETVDYLTCGNLSIFQKKKGYRYSLDSYLLAAFVEEEPGTKILDIGSGSGVISILLSSIKGLYATGVEIQEELAEMSMRSVKMAGLSDKVHIKCCDIKNYPGPKVDAILANPPFRPLDTGRINPRSEKAIARHELSLNLDTLLGKAYELLKPGGRFYIVYPPWRMPDLIFSLRAHCLEPKRMRFVHTSISSNSEICLVNAIKDGGKECIIERPLLVYSKGKTYHEEMESVFQHLSFEKKPLTSRRNT
jgi:tRNA1Val (adenine37-N6)-methyltransferase